MTATTPGTSIPPPAAEVHSSASRHPMPGHTAQLYEDERFLCDTVAHFLGAGLLAGEPVVVIASAARHRALRERLAASFFDVERASVTGQIVWLDAAETLATFMVNGLPDAALFEARIGEILGGLTAARGKRVRAYGEMVDLLWHQQNRRAAIRLEELWNELGAAHSFSLLCAYGAYAARGLDGDLDADGLESICRTHTHVLPADGTSAIDGATLGPRELGVLQRRARILESEIEHRKALESALRDALEERAAAEESLRASLAREQASRAELQQVAAERVDLLAREQEARHEAETANRLKDDFLATLSHELRTPLNAILGWARVLRSGRLDADKQERALGTIERNANLQAQLIDDVLDVSRIIAGKMSLRLRNIDLAGVVGAAVDTVRPLAETRGIKLSVDLDPSAGIVSGDSDRMQQVVWNLLSNAIKFTPAGGQVEVSLDRWEASSRIRVKDTGRGIAPEFLPRVFDRFRQADPTSSRSHGGLGLGLSIVHQLVALHGGTATAFSEGDGKGAEFTICLPVLAARVTDEERKTPPSASASASLGGIRVLLVEDDADSRTLLEMLLTEQGAEVQAVGSSPEGLTRLQEWGPHVLVSDIGLPGEDGYELIRKARRLPLERGGFIPAIALTAFASAQDNRQAMLAGYQVHLPKPVEAERLMRIIAELARWGEIR